MTTAEKIGYCYIHDWDRNGQQEKRDSWDRYIRHVQNRRIDGNYQVYRLVCENSCIWG